MTENRTCAECGRQWTDETERRRSYLDDEDHAEAVLPGVRERGVRR